MVQPASFNIPCLGPTHFAHSNTLPFVGPHNLFNSSSQDCGPGVGLGAGLGSDGHSHGGILHFGQAIFPGHICPGIHWTPPTLNPFITPLYAPFTTLFEQPQSNV